MATNRLFATTRSLAPLVLCLLALALSLVACGSTPVPPTLPPPPPTAAPSPTAAAEEPTAAVAAAEAPTEPLATATAQPPATPTAEAATILPAQTLEPTQDWFVRNLMVGPGRTYVFLVALSEQEEGPYQLLYSDDDGQTWTPFPGGLPPEECLNNVNIDYAATDALFAGACEGGLYHWTGSQWERLSDQIVGTLEVVYQNSQVMWSANPAAGPDEPMISRSDDGGRTWVGADSGIDKLSGITHLGIDPRDSNTLYALSQTTLYRGTPDGEWQVIPVPESPSSFTGMATEGGNGALYFSLSTPSNQIWRSENPGVADIASVRWGLLHEFGENQTVTLMATGPSPSGLALYANLAETQESEDGITLIGDSLPYRSPDGGITWERIVIPGWIE